MKRGIHLRDEDKRKCFVYILLILSLVNRVEIFVDEGGRKLVGWFVSGELGFGGDVEIGFRVAVMKKKGKGK